MNLDQTTKTTPRRQQYEDPGMTVAEAMEMDDGRQLQHHGDADLSLWDDGETPEQYAHDQDEPEEPEHVGHGEEPDLSPDDEDALERAWKKHLDKQPGREGQPEQYGLLGSLGRMIGIGGKPEAGEGGKKQEKISQSGIAAPKVVPAPTMPAGRKVTVVTPKLMAAHHEHLGTGHLNEHHLADMTGAGEGVSVGVRAVKHGYFGPAFGLHARHADYTANRILHKDPEGKLVMHNADFYATKKGGGIGTDVFSRQVEHLQKHGVDRIEATAAGDKASMDAGHENGYWTWARLGYDGPIPGDTVARLPEPFKQAKTVQELMNMPGGKDAWKEYGSSFKASFDLKPGSQSLAVLNRYRAEKGLPPVPGTQSPRAEPWKDEIRKNLANGIKVYRGTGRGFTNDSGVAGKGEYASGSKDVASAYGPNVTESTVKLNNPLIASYSELNDLQKNLYGKSLTGFEPELSDKFDKWLRDSGYDGVALFDHEISKTVPQEVVKLSGKSMAKTGELPPRGG